MQTKFNNADLTLCTSHIEQNWKKFFTLNPSIKKRVRECFWREIVGKFNARQKSMCSLRTGPRTKYERIEQF